MKRGSAAWLLSLSCFAASLRLFSLDQKEADGIMNQAKGFLEARMYDRAVDRYQILLTMELEPWQTANVKYDIGCVYFAEGDWDRAISQFKSVPIGNEPSPVLQERLYSSLSVAYYNSALTQLEAKEIDYRGAIYNLRRSLLSASEAQKARCLLESLDSAQACSPSEELESLKMQTRRVLADALTRYDAWRKSHVSLAEDIPMLYEELYNAESAIDFLDSPSLDETQKSDYLSLFAREQGQWIPVWDALQNAIETGSFNQAQKKQGSEYFQGAKVQFEKMMDALKSGRISNTREALEIARRDLTSVLVALFHQDPMQIAIQRVVILFNKAFEQEAFQPAILERIFGELQRIEKMAPQKNDIAQTHNYASAKADLGKSSRFLERAGVLYKNEKAMQAKFVFMAAEAWAKQALLLFSENEPATLLKNAIQLQQQALAFTGFKEQLGAEDLTNEVDTITLDAQTRVLQVAQPFLKAVYSFQEKNFREKGPEGCQAHPWDQVLPDFEQGYRSASRAAMWISQKNIHNSQVLSLQKEAVGDWKKALHELQHPSQGSGGTCRLPQAPPAAPSKQPGAPEQAEPLKLSEDEALRLLQEMYIEDNPLRVVPIQAPMPEVQKPW